MKKIDISSRKHPDTYTLVDDDDYERLSKDGWFVKPGPRTMYACRNSDNAYMHRVILGLDSGSYGDHVNNNGLDNRRINLRVCTTKESARNRRKRISKKCAYTSAYKGVQLLRKITGDRWRAQITVNGKQIYLGRFLTEIEAAQAYDKAALKFHGSFSSLNF